MKKIIGRDKNGRFLKGHKHSGETKVKMKASDERKEKLRKRMIGNKLWKDKKHSEESKIKMSNNNAHYWKGKKLSENHKQKMMGKVPWNKGKTYEESYGKEKAEDMIQKMKKRKHSEETRSKISLANSNPSIETRNKIRQTLKSYYKRHPELVEVFKKRMRYVIIPKIDSSIEVKIQNFLTTLQIEFITHKYMNIKSGYQCDIFIPSMNLIIEADGDYWHGNPKKYPKNKLNDRQREQKERDSSRTKELLEKGYNVMRIWENEIRVMTVDDFRNKLLEARSNGRI